MASKRCAMFAPIDCTADEPAMTAGGSAANAGSSADAVVEEVVLPAGSPPPHLLSDLVLQVPSADFVLVVPSYNRPQEILAKTMKVILKQQVPLDRVFVFVANECADGQTESEYERYAEALASVGLPASQIVVGVRGIIAQRNFIVQWALKKYGELHHVVSMDDDLEGLYYKSRTGFDNYGAERGALTELEEGGLQAWIAHAAAAMVQLKAYIWSLNTSANPYFMRSDLISTANGMCNGYLYGFRVRSERKLLPCLRNATEDRERSVRYFALDGVVLRYKMYTATTKCVKNAGGLQDDWQGTMAERNDARKMSERGTG